MTAMQKAVCLVSGGLDSCVAAACAFRDGFTPAMLHVRYGQRTEEQEARAFRRLADFYDTESRMVCRLPFLAQIGGSALTDSRIPLGEGRLLHRRAPLSYVPFRNGVLLSLAAAWAEVVEAPFIYIGVVHEDASGYPDCRPSFIEAMNRAIQTGCRPESRITVRAPLIDLSKAEIVRLGIELEAPLQSTWSCYRGRRRPCGRCDSCLQRQRGFEEAGVRDPAFELEGSGP